MNIFGYSIVGTSRYEAIKRDLLKNQAECDRLRLINQEDHASITTLKRQASQMTEERDGLQKLVNSAQERESDLQRRLTASEAQVVAAQNVRVAHNYTLYGVGKVLLELKKAWQFRMDNPKMNPKDRVANNELIADSIAELDRRLPKKIEDPTDQAIKDLAAGADPSPTKKPAK